MEAPISDHSSRSHGGRLILAGLALAAAALACNLSTGGGQQDQVATAQAEVNAQRTALARTQAAIPLTQAPATLPPPTLPPPTRIPTRAPVLPPTAVPGQPPVQAPTDTAEPGNQGVSGIDTFDSDEGNWEIFDGAEIADGVFYLGQFADCGDVGSGSAFGCFSQCLACDYVSEYDMQVLAAYVDGVTERTFGLVLRFVDQNNDGLVNPEDYYLDFEISVYDKFFIVWEHLPGTGWQVLDQRVENNIAGGRKVNTLRAVAYDGGSSIDLYLNGTLVENIAGLPETSGTVGLVVGGRAIRVAFDDFEIEGTP
ncbi:MAG: hypothetical protein HY784_13285 [Chloroflexi bacterium]|nr:hypothetical protein [Chloroflexota bacterium]